MLLLDPVETSRTASRHERFVLRAAVGPSAIQAQPEFPLIAVSNMKSGSLINHSAATGVAKSHNQHIEPEGWRVAMVFQKQNRRTESLAL